MDSEKGQFCEGDAQFITRCVGEYESGLIAYARTLCGNSETAKDAAQDAFVELCKRAGGVKRELVKVWLFTVCRNKVFDAMRRKKFSDERDGAFFNSIADPAPDSSEALAAKEEREEVLLKMTALNPMHREALMLKYHSDLTHAQIAGVMNIPIGSVGVYVSRGLEELRKAMRKADTA